MRSLFEIVESVKDDQPVETDELKYALLAYVSMFNIEHQQLRKELLREKPSPKVIADMKLNNSFEMYNKALNMSPKEWLGHANDPRNAEYQKRRSIGKSIVDHVIENERRV